MKNQTPKPLPHPWQDKTEAERIALLKALFRAVPDTRKTQMK
jgi:hypothetical protein